jgi:GNAT superfamily N-acetyltransferase
LLEQLRAVTDSLDRITVREADASDLLALVQLRSECTGGEASDAEFAGRLREWFEHERAHRTTWLAFSGIRVIGMVSLVEYRRMPKPGQPVSRWGYVGHMFVREDARNRGIGTQLLAVLVAAADQRGYVRLVLSPSPRATSFFRRFGFEVADEKSAAPLFARSRVAE